MNKKLKGLITLIIAIMIFIPTSVFAHQVTFNTNEGSSISSQEVDDGEKATRPETNPEKDGYEFAGWYSDEELTELFDFDESITSDTTIYAKWLEIVDSLSATITLPAAGEHPVFTGTSGDNTKYTITEVRFMDNETTLTETDTFESGKGYSIYVLVRPTTGKTISSSAAFLINGESATYYSAISDGYGTKIYTYSYTVPVPTYEVTFNTNGGSAIDSQEIEEGETVVRPATDPTRTGYRFAGWYSDSGLEHEYDFTTPITVATTIYAKWNQEYTLTVLTNQPTCQVEYKSVKYDSGYTIKAIAGEEIRLYAKASENFAFKEATSATATVTNNGSIGRIITMPASDATVTFNFDRVYTITYVIEYDNTGPLVWDYAQAINGNVVNPGDPERDGYVFAGWYTDSTFATEYNFNTVVTLDKTIYAKWNKIHTVTFNTNRGNSIDSQNIVNGSKATKPDDPYRSGYEFIGWYTDSTFATEYNFNTVVTSDKTIYAKWIKVGANYNSFDTENMKAKYIVEGSGDITTSLYNALNNACTSASSLNSYEYAIVYIPSGNYTITEKSMMVCSNVYVVLEDDTTITKTAGTNLGIFRIRGNDTTISNATIYGGTLNLNGKGNNVLEITNANNVVLENINIKNGSNAGMRISNSNNVTINNLNITNNNTYGIHATDSTISLANTNIKQNGSGVYVKNTTINMFGSLIDNNTNEGISLNAAQVYSNGDTFSNNGRAVYGQNSSIVANESIFTKNKGNAIQGVSNSLVDIMNSTITDNTGDAIRVDSGVLNSQKNTIKGNGGRAIYINSGRGNVGFQIFKNTIDVNKKVGNAIEIANTGTEKVYIRETTITNGTNAGIRISNSKNVVLEDVTITNNNTYGIHATDSTLTIKNSEVNKNGTGLYASTSTATVTSSKFDNNTNEGISLNSATLKSNNSTYSSNGRGVYGKTSIIISLKDTYSSNKGAGVNAVETSSLTITESVSKNNTGDGINVDSSTLVSKSNTLNNNNRGIYVANSNANIENDKVYSNNNSGILLSNNTNNITIKNVETYNNKSQGIDIASSEATITSSKIYSNKNGLYATTASDVTLKSSEVYKNNEYGIQIIDGSKLYANNTANNKIYSNNYSGISASGKETEIYLHKNEITNNGVNPKVTADGAVGHGVGVSEGAYANITNNNISKNKECGISVFDGSKVKISNNAIENNGRHGIGARKNNTIKEISNNKINYNSYNGVLLADKTNGPLKNNTISNNGNFGLSVVDNSKTTLTSNTITYNSSSNISVSKGDAKLTGATVTLAENNYIAYSKSDHGIAVSGETKLIINVKGNKIERNKKNGLSVTGNSNLDISAAVTIYGNKDSGIYIKNSDASIKSAKVRKNTNHGVFINNSGYLNIWKSTITDNGNYGINVSGNKAKAKISSNTITGNKNGIVVNSKATITTIKSSTISNNKENGIMIKGKSLVKEITSNKIENNKSQGIFINGATVNKIMKNTINKNGSIGIMAKGGSTVLDIYKNTISNHSKYGIASYSSNMKKVTSSNKYSSNKKTNYYIGK